jgi:hypothetical protein
MKLLARFNTQKNKLDPYKVGEIVGPAAFTAGDWIVIRSEGNRPAKVEAKEDFAIRVLLGDKSDSTYATACYYGSQLGYPPNSELWSAHQKEQYRLCHDESWLRKRWDESFVEIKKSEGIKYCFWDFLPYAIILSAFMFLAKQPDFQAELINFSSFVQSEMLKYLK